MKAMLLAAGFGTRMAPLTRRVPKPAMPLYGRPLVAHTLGWLARHGVDEVVLNLHHCAEVMRTVAEVHAPAGLRLHFVDEPEIRGTGGGLVGARHLLGGEPFVVVNGDVFTELDLEEVVRAHRRHRPLATLALNAEPANAALFAVGVDSAGRILDFWGEPADAPEAHHRYAFTGVSVVEPRLVDRLPTEGFACVKERGYLPALERGEPLWSALTAGAWYDMGTPATYLRAHRELAGRLHELSGLPEVAPGVVAAIPIPDGVTVTGPACIGPNATLEPGARLGPNAFLGTAVTVRSDARVENAVAWDGATVTGTLEGAVMAAGEAPLAA